MTLEYKYVTIELTEDQKQMVELGMVKQESVNDMVLEVINDEASDGWEPLYPFSFPSVWFKRQIKVSRRKTTDKAN